MNKGQLIAVEGIDASGKSGLVDALGVWLRDIYPTCDVATTRALGGTPTTMAFRQAALNKVQTPLELVRLWASSIGGATAEIVQPTIARAGLVVTDRWVDSVYAIFGHADGVPAGHISNTLAQAQAVQPDIVLLLDITPEISARRMAASGVSLDYYESKPPEHRRLVREGFLRRVHMRGAGAVIIDASQTPDRVLRQAQHALVAHCGL